MLITVDGAGGGLVDEIELTGGTALSGRVGDLRTNDSMDDWPWICFLPGSARPAAGAEVDVEGDLDGDGTMMARLSSFVGDLSLPFTLDVGVMESKRARALLGVCAAFVCWVVTVGIADCGAGLAAGVGDEINLEKDDKSDDCCMPGADGAREALLGCMELSELVLARKE